jgi:hypothetical protein
MGSPRRLAGDWSPIFCALPLLPNLWQLYTASDVFKFDVLECLISQDVAGIAAAVYVDVAREGV